MWTKETKQTITATSPAAASTVIHTVSFAGNTLTRADAIVVDAILTGATGGTLDVYLQHKTGTDDWTDLIHFPQKTAASAATRYTCVLNASATSLVTVGGGTTAAPGVALAAGTVANVIPEGEIRIIFVAGGGTSAGASQTISMTPYSSRT